MMKGAHILVSFKRKMKQVELKCPLDSRRRVYQLKLESLRHRGAHP